MTRGKKLISLLAALIVLVGAIFAVTRLVPDEDAIMEEATFSIFTLETTDAAELTWSYGDETLTFENIDSSWVYTADSSFPLDSSYLDSMLSTLSDVTATKTIETPDDLSQYGLEDPVCTVSITTDAVTSFQIGDETSMGGERYLSLGDGNVYLVDDSILDSFAYGLYDIVQKESIPSMTDLTAFRVESETQNLSIEYLEDSGLAYNNWYVWFLRDGESYVTLDTELTDTFVGEITGLAWNECVNYSADETALAEYGLDAPPVTVTIDYVETSDEQEAESIFMLEIGGYTGSSYYARLAGSQMVYLIDASIGDAMLYTSYNELLPDEVLMMDWDTVTAIDITLDGEIYHIEKSTEETTDEDGITEESYVYRLDGEEIPDVSFLSDLTDMASTGSEAGLTPERRAEISFLFYRDTETFPEVALTFYQYDSSSCLVELNGETRLFVAREDVVAIVEAVNSFCLD